MTVVTTAMIAAYGVLDAGLTYGYDDISSRSRIMLRFGPGPDLRTRIIRSDCYW